ncbi:sugar transferase [Candidatus Shapirobacteria bacterium]|nr:sugar transferase [Candidatus Shapirobacteria bacterium]
MIERLTALVLIIVLSPVLVILSVLIVLTSGWPFWYAEQRVGMNGKKFWLYKFRSMRFGADREQEKLRKLNEADGPVFKIYNDPRLTKFGGFLFHSGLDELLQLFNIVRGEMSLVGPRPLPVAEENKIKEVYKNREKVNPGIISPWIFMGYHKLSFAQWMQSDLEYVKNKNWFYDLKLVINGGVMLVRLVIKNLIF